MDQSEASSSNANSSEIKIIGDESSQSEDHQNSGGDSDDYETPDEDYQSQECSGGDVMTRHGETIDKEVESDDTQRCMLKSVDSCKPVFGDECCYRMDEADENGNRVGNADISENRIGDIDVGGERAGVENVSGNRMEDHSSANNGELNSENKTDEPELADGMKDDKERTVNGADKSSETLDEVKARQWSKQEVQDLLIKAINFRAPIKDLKTILRCGVDVNAAVKSGLHPLHYAAYCDNDASVEVLLNAGANVNSTDDIGYTPLHLCARRGNYRTMQVLIENGSMINFNEPGTEIRNREETNKLGFTTTEPLNLAVQNVHPKCAKLLLENGARADNKYFMGQEICLAPLDEVECLELLLQHGADPNVFNRCGLSPLMKACKDHHIPAVRVLIKYGADINAICPPLFEQKSVLQFAIISGNIVIVNILLQRGAKITRQGEYNYSALHTAIIKGRPDICRVLLQYRADPNERTVEGATGLMLACCTPELKDRKEIVQLLIDCGADVNAFSPTYSFFDPYLAALTEYMKNIENSEEFSIVELLVRQGAEVHFSSSGLDRELRRLRDPFSILPYSHCMEKHPEIFNMLVNLANKYCPLLIHANEKLSEEKKEALLYVATRPRELKHQVRVMLRQKLSPGLPENVEKLPLPAILKTYILIK